MDDYIVHIYRRKQHNSKELVGLVEVVETEEQQPFHTIEELWSILANDSQLKQIKKPRHE